MSYLAVKWLHILSSTLLFGTGLGSAFYMFFTSLSRDVRATAVVVRYVVYLVHLAGFPLSSAWIMWSIGLYLLAGAAWLPVVWMQIKMRDMALEAARTGTALPAKYWRYLRVWVALGIVAFLSLVVVFYLMVAKPQ